jgi:hypothetical protein
VSATRQVVLAQATGSEKTGQNDNNNHHYTTNGTQTTTITTKNNNNNNNTKIKNKNSKARLLFSLCERDIDSGEN